MNRHFRHLESYYQLKQELIVSYPHVLTLEEVESIAEIRDWVEGFSFDYRYHIFLYRDMEFRMGYDFFFRECRHALLFKLTWGGITGVDLPPLPNQFVFAWSGPFLEND